MKIVLVGEAWGAREAEFQHSLVGPSGRELTLELGISGLAPFMTLRCRKCKRETSFTVPRCEHCQEHLFPNEFDLIQHWKTLRNNHGFAVTNVFNCRPPNNDLGFFFGTTQETPMPSWKASNKTGGSHLLADYFLHLKRLWRELGDLNPNLIIATGNAACWATLGQTKITALRGTVAHTNKDLTGLDIKVLPTFHPAAVLRQMPMRVSVIADLTKAKREAEFPEIRRPERWILIIDPDRAGLESGYDWLSIPTSAYAVDIETRAGQITTVGFARSKSEALVVCFRNEDGSSYWPTEELEFLAWKLVIHGLGLPTPKIFQNGVYDLSYFFRMGIHVNNACHDTMLWSHSEYPELPKSLGYLGSIYANDVAWKTMVRHSSLKRDE